MHRLGFASLAAAMLVAAAVLPLDAPPLALFACPFKTATGLPCLTCGCAHAFHFFVRGAFADAFLSSPLGFVLALACVVHLLLVVVRVPWPVLDARRWRWPALSLLALNWGFLVLRSRP